MCNFVEIGDRNTTNMLANGENLVRKFPKQVKLRGVPLAEPGKCIRTDKLLSYSEMHPGGGKTPRFMTDAAYLEVINRSDKTGCAFCGIHLDQNKVNSAYSQPRELKFHFCNECFDFISILAAIVHSQPAAMVILDQAYSQLELDYSPQTTVDDLINARPINQLEHVPVQRMIPSPSNKKVWNR